METSHNNPNKNPNDGDDRGAAVGQAKLLPEWNLAADDQIVLAGLAIVVAMLGLFGWNAWRSGDDPAEIVAAITSLEAAADDLDPNDQNDVASDQDSTSTIESSTTEAPTAEAPLTTVNADAASVVGDVQAAVAPLSGAITGTNQGEVAILTGYVASAAESNEAEEAATRVDGIERVENLLVILEPAVEGALDDQGVKAAGAAGVGTVITVTGTLATEADRAPALAAAKVEGVSRVVDELEVSVTADLNALPQVQFATGSAVILEASFADLDQAAVLLQGAPEAKIEVQGYTDTQGDESANQQLSEDRSNAVRDYLVGQGLAEENLTAKGFGETEQFGAGDTAEALAANRLVRFEQLG